MPRRDRTDASPVETALVNSVGQLAQLRRASSSPGLGRVVGRLPTADAVAKPGPEGSVGIA